MKPYNDAMVTVTMVLHVYLLYSAPLNNTSGLRIGFRSADNKKKHSMIGNIDFNLRVYIPECCVVFCSSLELTVGRTEQIIANSRSLTDTP